MHGALHFLVPFVLYLSLSLSILPNRLSNFINHTLSLVPTNTYVINSNRKSMLLDLRDNRPGSISFIEMNNSKL